MDVIHHVCKSRLRSSSGGTGGENGDAKSDEAQDESHEDPSR
jgi:hypothetical protein